MRLGYQIPNFTYPGVGPAELFEAVAAPGAAPPIAPASTPCS